MTLPLWLRYVDDTSTAVHKDEIDDFHEHLNGQNADIQFTKEIEENGKIPFLDCLVTRDNNKLRTTIYRKPTHTDRLLDQSSYNPTSHKATTIRTLTRRAQLVCDSPDSLTDENKYLDNVFNKNNYNRDFIRHNTYRNSKPNATNTNATPVTTATIPYIKGTSETIARILQPYNIRVAHKPITTLTPLCNRPSGIFIFTGFLEKTSLGWPISHWVGLFSGGLFFISLFDTKMASCRK